MGGGDEGGVVVPAEPGSAFEVVQTEGVFEFAVVVFDAPADLRQPDEFFDGGVGAEGGDSSSRWVRVRRWAIRRSARPGAGCRRRRG